MKRPAPSTLVAGLALVVAASGTSYAAGVAANSVTSGKIVDGTIKSRDIADGTITKAKLRDGVLAGITGPQGPQGPQGEVGPQGPAGADGEDGTGRWLLVDRNGAIVAQSGGFAIRTAYDLVNNSGAAVPGGALGNVYIDANEDLSNNGIVVSIALQNQYNQDEIAGNAGRNPGADANPEFSGEITSTICGVSGIVACAPVGANNRNHFVVSPRLSDGQVTTSGADVAEGVGPNTHKRFYVIITGDSSDYVEPSPAIPAVPLAPNPAM